METKCVVGIKDVFLLVELTMMILVEFLIVLTGLYGICGCYSIVMIVMAENGGQEQDDWVVLSGNGIVNRNLIKNQ